MTLGACVVRLRSHLEWLPRLNFWNVACSMIYNDGPRSSLTAWLPLCYDTFVLGATLHLTVPIIRRGKAGVIGRTILEEGIQYYW